MPKTLGTRRIAEARSHLRGSRIVATAMFPSPGVMEDYNIARGLCRPHTDRATVTGTGTLQPASCGKGPKAVGESVMGAPRGAEMEWVENPAVRTGGRRAVGP
jgi:hypothetical protein